MTEAIVVAIITGGLALLGTIYSSNKTAQTMNAKLTPNWTDSKRLRKRSWKTSPMKSGNTTILPSVCPWLKSKSRSLTTAFPIWKSSTSLFD